MIVSVEPVTIKGKCYLTLIAELNDYPACAVLAFYWPGCGWVPSAFTVATALPLHLFDLPDPDQVPFHPPFEVEPPITEDGVRRALVRFQTLAQHFYPEGPHASKEEEP